MKIAVISPSARNLDHIGQVLRTGAATRTITLAEGGMSKLRSIAEQQRPNLIVIESISHDSDDLGPLEYVTAHHPQTALILLCSDQTPDFLIKAMRAGVREVLPAPVGDDTLNAAIARVEQKLGVVASLRAPGQILAFIACKGGSGTTFLATNLAYQLASRSAKVLLIDCNLQFGDAVLFAHDRKPTSTLADIARDIHRLDAAFLASSVVQVTPNYALLAAPDDPGQATEVKPEHIDALLGLAVNLYDHVLVDVGRVLDPVTVRVLDHANIIYPVLQVTLPFIRDASRLLAVFRSLGYPPQKIELVVNRFEKGIDLSLADLQRTLGVSEIRTIPNSYAAVAAAVNQGVPLAQLTRNNPVTRSLDEFTASLMPQASKTNNWFGKLLKLA